MHSRKGIGGRPSAEDLRRRAAERERDAHGFRAFLRPHPLERSHDAAGITEPELTVPEPTMPEPPVSEPLEIQPCIQSFTNEMPVELVIEPSVAELSGPAIMPTDAGTRCLREPSELALKLRAQNDQLRSVLRFILARNLGGIRKQNELADRLGFAPQWLSEFMIGRFKGGGYAAGRA